MTECPRCHAKDCVEVEKREDSSWFKCPNCEYQFNEWHIDENKLKEIFGENYKIYL